MKVEKRKAMNKTLWRKALRCLEKLVERFLE